MSRHQTLFVSLARGGSKRLANKNLLRIGGVSLIGRAVRAAKAALHQLGGKGVVVVSTDDDRIAAEARRWGAETPFLRPDSLAGDDASSVAALRHVIRWYEQHGQNFGEVVLLQPTSPLRMAQDVVAAVRKYRQSPRESVVTVGPTKGGGSDVLFDLDGDLLVDVGATQKTAELNGAVYVCSPRWIAEQDRLSVSGQTEAVMMPASRSVDVDTAYDLRLAQSMWEESLLWSPGRCLVIAEVGVNHNGCVETAKRMIDAANEAGADAVKFQTFSANRLACRNAPKATYQQETTGSESSQHEMLAQLELSANEHEILLSHCRERGIHFLSSAFDEDAVALLDRLDVPAIKIGSGEVTNHPLLRRIGATGRPVILSTGCSWLHEVGEAVEVLQKSGCSELALLHCVSAYPADPADVNLRAMVTLSEAFGVPVGYSDHTKGLEIACAAVAMGARIIEKHFTLDRNTKGPDHRASIEPNDLAKLVESIRRVESAIGDGIKRPAVGEENTREVARRSIVASDNLPAGTILNAEHLQFKRPGSGISPAVLESVIGLRLVHHIDVDEPLTWAHLQAQGGRP